MNSSWLRAGLSVALSLPGLAGAEAVIGLAKRLDSGTFLYREIHQCQPLKKTCHIRYENSEGSIFAEKKLDYAESAYAPSVWFEDKRKGYTVEVGPHTSDAAVIDAGFDNFVRSSWEELVRGEQMEFSFLPADSKRALLMTAVADATVVCAIDQLCVRVEGKSWFVGLFLDPILLAYDRAGRQLLSYRGVSNIRDEEGVLQNVLISYEYRQDVQ
ncbi:MAG: hypothetical protein ACI9GW_002206 [Halieaceae bacterium]|jgi:hypothetical protein